MTEEHYHRSPWTDEADEHLRAHWNKKPSSEIIAYLNSNLSVPGSAPFTKNSVVSRARRLGLSIPRAARTEEQREIDKATLSKAATKAAVKVRERNRPVQTRPKPVLIAKSPAHLAGNSQTPDPTKVPDSTGLTPRDKEDMIIEAGVFGMTFFERRCGADCCMPHPEDKPGPNMRVCGMPVESADVSYCKEHRNIERRLSLTYRSQLAR